MSDLVERLRDAGHNEMHATGALYLDAADQIALLTEQLRLTQIDWNNVATEKAGLQAVVDAARGEVRDHENLAGIRGQPCDCRLCAEIRALDGEP